MTQYLPIVEEVATAMARRRPGADLDALTSDGTLALLKVVEKYDPDDPRPFAPFVAHCVRQAMLTGLHRWDPLRNVRGNGRGAVPLLLSCDAPAGVEGGDATLVDFLATGDDGAAEAERHAGAELVRRVAGRLPHDVGRVLVMHFVEDLSLTEIAMELDTTDEHVRRLYDSGLSSLQHQIETGNVPELTEQAMSIRKTTRQEAGETIGDRDLQRYAHLSTTELKEMLAESIRITADHVRRAATIFRILRERGEDLGAFQGGLFRYLERVSDGRLIPDVVIKLYKNPKLVDKLSGTTPELQRLIIRNEPVEVVVKSPSGDDGFERRCVEPIKLRDHQLAQVLARDHVRTADEQKAWLNRPGPTRPATARALPRPATSAGAAAIVVVDTEQLALRVGEVALSLDDLVAYVRQLQAAAALRQRDAA